MIIAGTMTGSEKNLSKEGDGLTLSLTNANTYTGDTRIFGGVLSLDHSMAMQNSTLDTLNSVAGSATSGLRTTLASLTLGGLSGDKNLASIFTTTSGGYSGVTALTLNPESGSSPNYSGVVANGAPSMVLIKVGTGTQVLAGNNTYTGNTTISANSGTLEVGGTGKLGNGTYAGAITIGSGSIFRYSSNSAQTLDGAISGAGTLTKSGNPSTLTLGGSNTSFTGSVSVSSGTLGLDHANALSSASAVSLTGAAALSPTAQNVTINAPITVSSSPTINAPDFGSGSVTSTLTLGGAITGSGSVIFGSTSAIASNSQQTIRLNAQSTYTGSTTLNPADADANLIVKLGIANALPPATVLSINGVDAGGTGRFVEFEMNGFSQALGGLQNTPANQRTQQLLNSSTTAATLTLNNSADYTFSGNINGTALSLIKAGSGRQTLAGTSNYAGTTTISGGKLQGVVGGSCANSSVTINNAMATFGVSITNNTKTWTCAALTTSAAGKLEFVFGAVLPGSIKPLTVTGQANFTVTPSVRVVVSTGLAPGTYPLMIWGSISGMAPTAVSVQRADGTNGLAGGTVASLNVVGTTLNLVITGTVSIITKANNATNLNVGTSWVGNLAPGLLSTARWNNTVTSANTTVLGANMTWAGIVVVNPTGTVTINAGHTLTLGENDTDIDLGGSSANMTLNCPIILGDTNAWNVATGRTLTIGGVVSGAFSLTKQGAGTAVLTGVNIYTGDTIISPNSGTLEIGGTGRLGNGTYAGAFDIGSGSIFRYNSSVSQTLSGAISGAGGLVKNAASALAISAANPAFTGSVTVNAGRLDLEHTNALGSASAITLSGGASLLTEVTGISISAPILLATAATNATLAFGRDTAARGTITLNGSISGAGNFVFTTPNNSSGNNLQTIYLRSPNTYGGTTLITTGNASNTMTVKAGVANSLPTTTVLSLNGGNGSGSGRTVSFDLNGYSQTLAGLTNTTGLTLRNQRIFNSGGETALLTINNSADYTFSGNITGAGLELLKLGAGTQTLSGSNANTGSTTISEGILSLGHSQAMQYSVLETSDSISGDAANGLRTTVTTLTLGGLSGDKNLASVFTTTTGGYTGVTALTLNPDTGTAPSYSGVIANGAASMTLIKTSLGTQILSGANTYTGNTIVSDGKLILSGNRTASAGGMTVANIASTNATLDITNGNFSMGTFTVASSDMDTLGTVNHSAGSITVTGTQLIIGNGTSTGTYHFSGGTLTGTASATRGIILGTNTDTIGNFIMTGGTLAMGSSNLQVARSENAAATGITGNFTQTGGMATIGTLGIGGLSATNNSGNIGNFSVTGGTFSAAAFNALAGGDNSIANLTIGGSAEVTLPAFPTTRGTGATATLTFDGGILKPLAASTAYIGGLTNAFIKAGGATIDTTNGSITINQPLLADSASAGGGLTKSGSSTLSLTGASTYTGDTSVNGGTLALGANNVLANSTAVSIGNATLNVSSFSDVVGTLDITGNASINLGIGGTLAFANSSAIDWTDGALTIAGTFVSGSSLRFGTTSSALTPAQLSLISATGLTAFTLNPSGYLTATTVTTFPTWISGTFSGGASVPLGMRGPTDDPDNDGINNLIEYATRMNPTANDVVPQSATKNGSVLDFSFTKSTAATDVFYTIEWSDTLGNDWSTAGVSAPTILSDNGTTQQMNATVPAGSGVMQRFVRLKVTR
jgi:fibronectin-binding autotransporter adhesin